jgi:spore coat polysaccharide biosynthesis protein SpsF
MKPNIAAVIQARMGSTRLPGKVLKPLAGCPMIEHIVRRAQQVRNLTHIVLAVPEGPAEDPLIDIARALNIDWLKGPEEDVLQRFILAGDKVRADHILRICSDSPLIDIPLMDSLITAHLQTGADYTIPDDGIPRGAGTEIVRFDILKQIAQKTTRKPYREHVTVYIHDHPQDFQIRRVAPPDYLQGKDFRLTVDTDHDFLLMDRIYAQFCDRDRRIVDLRETIAFLQAHPEIARLNADVVQKDWRLEK